MEIVVNKRQNEITFKVDNQKSNNNYILGTKLNSAIL